MGVTSAWSPLGNFLEGQVHPNVFCLLPFIEPGFSISLYILYIIIFIYFIYFFIVLVVPYSALTDYDRSVVLTLDDRPDPQLWGHCRSTHNSSMICFLCLQ